MEKEEQIRQRKNSITESFASLSIGLWTVSLIGYLTSAISWATYSLAIVGTISALLSIYLILPCNWTWRQKSVLEFLENNKIIRIIKLFVWFIIIAIFGVSLIQTEVIWLIVTGLITIIIAPIVFSVGLLRMNEDNKKERHA